MLNQPNPPQLPHCSAHLPIKNLELFFRDKIAISLQFGIRGLSALFDFFFYNLFYFLVIYENKSLFSFLSPVELSYFRFFIFDFIFASLKLQA